MNPPAEDWPREISVRADASEVRTASSWLENSALERGIPSDQIGRLDICLNEILANIISHGGTSARSFPISISLDVRRTHGTGHATLVISDAGTPFDPTAAILTPRPKTLADAEPGGLGLIMMRSNADNLNYRYFNGRNQIEFSVDWVEAP